MLSSLIEVNLHVIGFCTKVFETFESFNHEGGRENMPKISQAHAHQFLCESMWHIKVRNPHLVMKLAMFSFSFCFHEQLRDFYHSFGVVGETHVPLPAS